RIAAGGARITIIVHRFHIGEVGDRFERRIGHADLFTLIDVRRTAVEVQHDRQGGRGVSPGRGVVVAEAGDCARLVVVIPVQAVPPTFGEAVLPAAERRLERFEGERSEIELVRAVVERDMLELEDHVELLPVRVCEERRLLHTDSGHLADGEVVPLSASEHNLTHLLQELMDPWTRAVVRKAVTKSPTGRDDPVRKSWSLGDEVDHVHPEAVDATVEPPAYHVVDRGPDLWVLP